MASLPADELRLHASGDVAEYAANVVSFLEREPVQRNVLLTVIEQARSDWPAWTASPRFWWMTVAGTVVAAASWTPPFPLLVSTMPAEGVASLSEAVLQRAEALGIPLPGVTGPRDTARIAADALAARTGQGVVEDMRMLVHDLPSVTHVPRPSGEARRATSDDAPRVIQWLRAFSVEAHAPFGGDVDAGTRASIEASRIWLWLDGAPRSTATLHPAVGGVVRIGAVYTPPSERGHGYARALVHDISLTALRTPGVHSCTLNTDATNPVSNVIYRQIGYVPVAEHAHVALIS